MTTSTRPRVTQPTPAQNLTTLRFLSNVKSSLSEVLSRSPGLKSKLSKIYQERAIEYMRPLESQNIPLPFSFERKVIPQTSSLPPELEHQC
jgi:hypothetical protein